MNARNDDTKTLEAMNSPHISTDLDSSPISSNNKKPRFLASILVNKKPVALLLAVSLLIVMSGIFATVRIRQNSLRKKSLATDQSNIAKLSLGSEDSQDQKNQSSEMKPTGESKPATTPTPQPKPASSQAKPSVPVVTPIPTPEPKPVNTTNCLPDNPSPYATNYIHLTNSGYLQTNSYGETNKMYAALQFAGLLSAIDQKQVVVFAPNDYIFDNSLTTKQKDWMNASPENMKSVIGWQIVTGCVTWNGVNPVKDKSIGEAVTLNTLNGPVTYTHGGPGKVETAGIAIWDWFTSNGSVTFITNFIKPPQVL